MHYCYSRKHVKHILSHWVATQWPNFVTFINVSFKNVLVRPQLLFLRLSIYRQHEGLQRIILNIQCMITYSNSPTRVGTWTFSNFNPYSVFMIFACAHVSASSSSIPIFGYFVIFRRNSGTCLTYQHCEYHPTVYFSSCHASPLSIEYINRKVYDQTCINTVQIIENIITI